MFFFKMFLFSRLSRPPIYPRLFKILKTFQGSSRPHLKLRKVHSHFLEISGISLDVNGTQSIRPINIYIYIYIQAYTDILHMHAKTYTYIVKYTYVRMYVCTHARIQTHACIHTHAYIRTHVYIYTQACIRRHAYTGIAYAVYAGMHA